MFNLSPHACRPLHVAQQDTTEELTKKRPERKLTESKHKTGGRNVYGRVTSRHRGGGHKQLYRIIDFRRDVLDMPAKCRRSSTIRIALRISRSSPTPTARRLHPRAEGAEGG